MAKDSGLGTILKIGAIAGAGYLAYEWWQGQQSSVSGGASTSGNLPAGSTSTPAAPAVGTPAPPPPASPPAAPVYSGPSLAQMYQALLAAVIAGMQGGDTSVTCSAPGVSGYRGLGIPPGVRTVQPILPPTATRAPGVVGQIGQTHLTGGNRAPQLARPASCSLPYASPDVFNWYLVNKANVGIKSAPSSIDMNLGGSTPVDINTYWAAASPLLKASMPGLSGYRRRCGFGDIGPPDVFGNTGDFSQPTQTAPIQTGWDSMGNPILQSGTTLQQLGMSPVLAAGVSPTPPSTTTGPSTGMIALGAGALLLVMGVAAGGRR